MKNFGKNHGVTLSKKTASSTTETLMIMSTTYRSTLSEKYINNYNNSVK